MNHNDDQGVGVAHKNKLPKNQPQFSQTMGQDWVDKTKPKQAFISTVQSFYGILLCNGIFF